MLINEVKAISIKQGNTFTLSDAIGKFKKGEQVTVDKIRSYGNDIELHLSNDKGVTDTFYLDKNEEL
jgi:hypothetical protein